MNKNKCISNNNITGVEYYYKPQIYSIFILHRKISYGPKWRLKHVASSSVSMNTVCKQFVRLLGQYIICFLRALWLHNIYSPPCLSWKVVPFRSHRSISNAAQRDARTVRINRVFSNIRRDEWYHIWIAPMTGVTDRALMVAAFVLIKPSKC